MVENVNSRVTNVILGEKTQTLVGRPQLQERFGELPVSTSLAAFSQANAAQAAKLYAEVFVPSAPYKTSGLPIFTPA